MKSGGIGINGFPRKACTIKAGLQPGSFFLNATERYEAEIEGGADIKDAVVA